MHREVCLKHRKNRREILLRVRTQVPSWQRCLFFFVVSGAGVTTRAAHWLAHPPAATIPFLHLGGHRSRAGFLSANQVMPVQFRLAAPIFQYPQYRITQRVRRAPACAAWSPKPRGLGAAPGRRAIFSQSRGSQVGRQRPHKPSMSGFDSRPRHQFHGPLDHSGGHSPRKRKSTVQSRGGPPFGLLVA